MSTIASVDLYRWEPGMPGPDGTPVGVVQELDRAPYGCKMGELQDPYQGEWRHPDAEPVLPSLDEMQRSLCVTEVTNDS